MRILYQLSGVLSRYAGASIRIVTLRVLQSGLTNPSQEYLKS